MIKINKIVNFIRKTEIKINEKIFTNFDSEIEFEVNKYYSAKANNIYVAISNKSKNTLNSIKVGDIIEISAGYEQGIFGVIFKGEIDDVKVKYNDIKILGSESLKEYNNRVINEGFIPETKTSDIINKIFTNKLKIGKFELKEDYIYSRGLNLCEPLGDVLEKLTQPSKSKFYIKNTMVNFVPEDFKGYDYVIYSNGGLIRIDEITPEFETYNDTKNYEAEFKMNHSIEEDMVLTINSKDGIYKIKIYEIKHESEKFTTTVKGYDVNV